MVPLTSYWLHRQIKSAKNCIQRESCFARNQFERKEQTYIEVSVGKKAQSEKKISHGDF